MIDAICEFDEGVACANGGVGEGRRFTMDCEFGRWMIRILMKECVPIETDFNLL